MRIIHPDALALKGGEHELLDGLPASRGHFRYESGHHGDLWLDLDTLFVEARRMQGWASALARRAAPSRPEIVCGPLTGGAFLAQLVALELGAGFVYALREVGAAGAVRYTVPQPLRAALPGKRVLVVDDAVNAGSALLATLTDLRAAGAVPAGLASLLTLGPAASVAARRYGLPLFTMLALQRGMWEPDACPLCRAGTPLVDPAARSGA